MPNKYLGKYRNESTRAPWWDYSCNGAYLLPFVPKTGNIILGKLWQVKYIIQKLVMWPLQNGLKRRGYKSAVTTYARKNNIIFALEIQFSPSYHPQRTTVNGR